VPSFQRVGKSHKDDELTAEDKGATLLWVIYSVTSQKTRILNIGAVGTQNLAWHLVS